MDYEIDSMDRKILKFMQKDSRMPFLEMARELKVSGGTIHARVKKMKGMGVLEGSKVVINHHALGYKLSAFVGIQLTDGASSEAVGASLERIPDVLEVHYTTGGFGLFTKILVRETSELYEILAHKIQKIRGVGSTQTLIVLNTLFSRDMQF
ncbi:MAG: Lrp/AsnC ligand binding domain-containing protein [Pseudobacteriovorax sp.]|nr:Lrp/AsnC ligand binding domain-containing protein [Pseudobacteriovorax sp.]